MVAFAALAATACGLTPASQAQDAVRRGLLDPDSAEFRDVSVCLADRSIIKGDVNSKNTFGGYVGFKPFFYDGFSVAYAVDDAFTALMDRCYGPEITKQAHAIPEMREIDKASAALVNARDQAANTAESTMKHTAIGASSPKSDRFPYVAPDGVDIRNAEDEANWQKYGTTDPAGGE